MSARFSVETTEIPLKNGLELILDIESGAPESLLVIPFEIAMDEGEESFQLLEGCSYSFDLPDKYSIENIPKIVKSHARRKNQGRITTGIYVGRLELKILYSDVIFDTVAVEVRSRKADYRTEYRKMLEDITFECTELLMIHSSPVTQRFTVDHKTDSKTIYQRFAFVKSIVDSAEFRNAVHRVISMPVTSWTTRTEEKDIRKSGRITGSSLRQIVSGSNRVSLPESHSLRKLGIDSVPTRLTTTIKVDTVDTPENRFVKHALKEFKQFCTQVILVINKSDKTPFILKEAEMLDKKLGEYMSHSLFKEVSNPTSLPLNSPILQRKEGYREILRVWLMFDLAAMLTWNALDNDSYHVGKRDVATLYEYWLFFKLFNMVKDIVKIDRKETEKLIIKTSDGMGLQLRAGRFVAFDGVFEHRNRTLNVKYSYNRTFTHKEYPKVGSWTQQMRPDYTLSFWPSEFEEDEAEEQELIVHIHFDAKYRVKGLEYLINDTSSFVLPDNFDELAEDEKVILLEKANEEKILEKEGNYKRADLLKMHAYKDAIRRTVGAYVLYPGSKKYEKKGFHEIIPGLGAFPVSPSNDGNGIGQIKTFIQSVIDHICNRATRREELSYHRYDINNKDIRTDLTIYESLPEKYGKLRVAPIAKSKVLIGYMQDKQTNWIYENNLYNIRFDIPITPDLIGADYLLLYSDTNKLQSKRLIKIIDYPEIWSDKKLIKYKYPNPSQREYFIYKLEKCDLKNIAGKYFSIEKLLKYSKYDVFRPFAVTLSELVDSII